MKKFLLGGFVTILLACGLVAVLAGAMSGGNSTADSTVAQNKTAQTVQTDGNQNNGGQTDVKAQDEAATRPARTEQSAGDQDEDTSGHTFQLSQEAPTGNVVWKITGAQTRAVLKDEIWGPKRASGKWVIVSGTITNNGQDSILADDSVVHLVDSRGRQFDSSSEGLLYVPEEKNMFLKQINPGLTKQFQIIFEVPKDATGLSFRAGDMDILGSGEDIIVPLGI